MMKLSRGAYAAAVHTPSGLQVESWRLLWEELAGDAAALGECEAWKARRREVRPQLAELLGRYLSGAIGTEELRATFDQRTRTSWDAFGLRGLSGAMFLNKLVKHVTDGAPLAAELRAVLPVPADAFAARHRLPRFVDFLRALTAGGTVETRQLQPARAAFFVSMWWHVQRPELWPGFHQSARLALQLEEGIYVPTGEPTRDYLAFRDAFRSLAAALKLTGWELEYLCWWHQHRSRRDDAGGTPDDRVRRRRPRALHDAALRPRPHLAVREPDPERDARDMPATPGHTHVQWLLATVGRKLGCRVWIAANDRHREWNGETLGDLSVRRLPSLGLDPDAQRIVSLIDVVWLKGANQVAAAFEVEHTTSVYSGLLRMADLSALSPNLNFPLYIVAPHDRIEKVRRELSRPTFQLLELHRRCGFFSAEALVEAADDIMQWASGPAAIERLASRVGDVRGGSPE